MEETDFAEEYKWLWQESVELSKKLPDNEHTRQQAIKAQANYVIALALQSK